MSSVLFDNYYVRIGLTHDMLGTNPMDLNVMDKHIIDRQRKLITDNSQVNKAINKYLDAKTISTERAELELGALRGKIEEVLGTPLTDEEFIKMKEGDFKKITDLRESMKELDEKGITCFFRNHKDEVNTETGSKKVCIGSHMILGFLKAASEAIVRTRKAAKGKVLQSAAYTASIINQHVSVKPDLLNSNKDVKRDDEGKPIYLQRPLRAMTAQGPRVSLAKSEVVPEGAVFEFTLQVLKGSPLKEEHIKEILSYGQLKGLGQWRNAGYGRFEVVEFTHLKPNENMPAALR